MRASRRSAILLALLATFARTPLSAQDPAPASFPQQRHGFWWSLGLGYGRMDFSCGDTPNPVDGPPFPCAEAGRAHATLGSLRVGYALSQQVAVSMLVDASHRVGTSEGVVDLGAALRLYPLPARGWFVEAGVSRSEFRGHATDGPDEVGRGVGLVAGTGWDLRVDRKMSLTPVLQVHYGHQGDTGMPNVLILPDGSKFTVHTRVHETVVTFGVAVTFH